MIDSNYINGDVELLYIDYGDGYFPIGSLTANSIEENVDTISSTTRDNGGWKTHVLNLQGYTISFSGLIMNTIYAKGDFSKVSYDRIAQIKRNRQLINWKTEDENKIFIDSGQGHITSLSKESNTGEYVSFSASILGYGEPNSTTGKDYPISDGAGKIIEDGNNNNITS